MSEPRESNNFKIPGTGNDEYGEYRLELAIYVRDKILPLLSSYTSFIENGTLLGAWRNGKFIVHDDDFDFGILINDKTEIKKIYEIIKTEIKKCEKYDCRLITKYADKIEIFQPEIGNYFLAGKYRDEDSGRKTDYHYVSIDLQFYLREKENKTVYKLLYYINPFKTFINSDLILPLKEIELEKEKFMAPNKTKEFLEEHYGSLNPNAKYSEKTGKYHL